MPVRFFGPVNENTGYGNAVINFAKAFSSSGINTKFMIENSSGGKELIKTLNNFGGNTNIDFYLHCPPFNRHKSYSYKIGYFYWEADQLPQFWSSSINKVNELWVPCNLVKGACIKAKFKGPIKIIPTPSNEITSIQKISLPSLYTKSLKIDNSTYKFYSIFQWQNRKGFKTLINAYLKSFSENDNVVLILKVNQLNNYNKIKSDILEIKRKLNQKYYPPIYLSDKIIDRELINGLHLLGDCYVSSHHGEGWGMPIHDAMRFGKQIIVTKFGGITEWLDDSSAHIIKHTLGPVSDMEWSNLYGNYQNWAYPSQSHLISLFKDVYQNHSNYQSKGDNAKKIAETMTISSVSSIIAKELKGRA